MSQSPYRLSTENLRFLKAVGRRLSLEAVIGLSQAPEIVSHLPLAAIDICRLRELICVQPVCLSVLYELKLSKKERFERGITYTPAGLAEIAARMTAEHVSGDDLHILDPASGGGILLLALADQLGARVSKIDALDLDPNAIILTRCALRRSQSAQYINCTDALQPGTATLYDAIIMNPPYGSARDRPNLAGLAKLKESFGGSAGDKLNLYMAFVLRYIPLLKPNGVLTAIIPNSWLGIDNGAGFRDLLLRGGYIRELRINNSDAFSELGVETVILTIKNSYNERFKVVYSDNTSKIYTLADFESSTRISLAPSTGLLQRIGEFKRLSDLTDKFEPRIAIQAYRTGSGAPPQTLEIIKTHPFHCKDYRDGGVKYLEGRDVGRYRLGWSGEYLEYGPWLAECPPISRFTGPRLLIREVLGAAPRIVQASLTEETAVYNRSVLHIQLVSAGSKMELLALLGYLNSSLVSLYLLQNGRKTQRGLFPKIVIADLKELPIPTNLLAYPNVLGQLVESRLACKDPSIAKSIDDAIDDAVIRAVGFNVGAKEVETEIMATARLLGLPISPTHNQSLVCGAVNI